MKIYRNPLDAGREFPAAVVAIGKFDAVHRGHQRILRAAARKARAFKTACLVLSFDPSADQHLRLYPYRPLLPLAEKIRRLAALGADGLVLLPFDRSLACVSPEAFVRDILVRQLGPMAVFVGGDFCFGKDRAGDAGDLETLGREHGFLVYSVPLLKSGGRKIAAADIRRLLDEGRRAEAEKLLGWRFDEAPRS